MFLNIPEPKVFKKNIYIYNCLLKCGPRWLKKWLYLASDYLKYSLKVQKSVQYSQPLVYDYLLSITNEYFVKLTYIPLKDLCQNV